MARFLIPLKFILPRIGSTPPEGAIISPQQLLQQSHSQLPPPSWPCMLHCYDWVPKCSRTAVNLPILAPYTVLKSCLPVAHLPILVGRRFLVLGLFVFRFV